MYLLQSVDSDIVELIEKDLENIDGHMSYVVELKGALKNLVYPEKWIFHEESGNYLVKIPSMLREFKVKYLFSYGGKFIPVYRRNFAGNEIYFEKCVGEEIRREKQIKNELVSAMNVYGLSSTGVNDKNGFPVYSVNAVVRED